MNRVYKIVWNAARQIWAAVCEIAKGAGKARSGVGSTKITRQSLSPGFPGRKAPVALALLAIAALSAHAQVTIPSSTSTVELSTLSPGSSSFDAPSNTSIDATGNGIQGNGSQNWTLSNYGSVTGTNSGIYLQSQTSGGALVDNYGSVLGQGAAGVNLVNGGTLNNHAGANIYHGAQFGQPGTLNNDGTISLLAPPSSTGVHFDAGGVLTQSASGIIDASTSYSTGVVVNGGTFHATNSGTIKGGFQGVAIYDDANATIDNLSGGTISSSLGNVISAFGQSVTINNSGLIQSMGGTAYTGVRGKADRKLHLNNLSGGVIDAGTAVDLLGDGSTIYNSGTITGHTSNPYRNGTAIRIFSNNSSVTLDTGSVTNGDIVSTGTGNTLTLKGTGSANSDISGIDSLTMAGGDNWTLGGSVSTKTTHVDSGTLAIGGVLANNDGSGVTTVARGATLQIGTGTNQGRVTGNVASEGRVVFNRDWVYRFYGQISGTGSVEVNGPKTGTVVFSADQTYTGGTKVTSGTLQIGDYETGSVLGDIENNATVQFHRDDYTYGGVISGSGLLETYSRGLLTLTGANSRQGRVNANGYTTLRFMQPGAFEVTGDYTTLGHGTTDIGQGGSTLDIGGTFKQAADSALNVSIGTAPAIVAKNAALDGTLTVRGFAAQPQPVKSSEATNGQVYTLVHTSDGITGNFVNNPLQPSGLDYLPHSGFVSTDGRDYNLGFHMAWTQGGQREGTGAFTMPGNTAFDVDVALADQSGPFDSGWNGKSLTKNGDGLLLLSADNSYTGGTTVNGGTLQLGNGGTTGNVAGDIENNASLVINRSDTMTLDGVVRGSGSLKQAGAGTTVLTRANTYGGLTHVAAGTLKAGAANTFSANSAHLVAAGATLDAGGFDQRLAALDNAGTVNLQRAVPGNTLTVTGAYVGRGGTVQIGTDLQAGTSDRLVLDGPGASATGTTILQVNRTALGAPTTGDGIEVVSGVNGATTTAQTTKDAFTLADAAAALRMAKSGSAGAAPHIDAGAYEYRLYAGAADGSGENWYLRSTSPDIDGPAPGQGIATGSGGTPDGGSGVVPTYRAEVPLVAALPQQLRQGDLSMMGNLRRRVGDDDASTSTGTDVSIGRRAWARSVYTDMDIRQEGTVAPRSEGYLSGLQAGVDLLATPTWRSGLYVGYLQGGADVSGRARGIVGRMGNSELQSRYIGGYATWQDAKGRYADAVIQAGDHRYTLQPDLNSEASGKASSVAASIEVGQSFQLGNGLTLEPQAQLVYQDGNVHDLALGGARVEQDVSAGWIGRLGLRAKGEMATAAGKLQPYGRADLYQSTSGTDTARFISPTTVTGITSGTGSTAAELAGGLTLSLSKSTSVYAEVGRVFDVGGKAAVRSNVQGNVGVRIQLE